MQPKKQNKTKHEGKGAQLHYSPGKCKAKQQYHTLTRMAKMKTVLVRMWNNQDSYTAGKSAFVEPFWRTLATPAGAEHKTQQFHS